MLLHVLGALCMLSACALPKGGAAREGGQGPPKSQWSASPTQPSQPTRWQGRSRTEARQPGVASAVHDATEIGLTVTG